MNLKNLPMPKLPPPGAGNEVGGQKSGQKGGQKGDSVKWQLRNLTKSGRIARIGGDRGGHWEVHDVEHPKT